MDEVFERGSRRLRNGHPVWRQRAVSQAVEQRGAPAPGQPYRFAAILVVVVHGLIGVAFNMLLPIKEAPDEAGHFELIASLINQRSLPRQNPERPNYAHHPPLYYVLAAVPASLADVNDVRDMPQWRPNFWDDHYAQVAIAIHTDAERYPFSGRVKAYHLARAVSNGLGMVTVALTILIGWRIFPARPALGLVAGSIVAFNPQFLFIHGAVNNDSLLTATTAAVLWQLARVCQAPAVVYHWFLLGVFCGLALLSKSSAVIIVSIAGLAWLVLAGAARSWRFALASGGALSLPVLVLAGWWFARNIVLYGDPFGWQVYQLSWSVNLRQTPFAMTELPFLLWTQFRSFWGLFGWMNVFAPPWFYALILVFCAVCLSGLIRACRLGQLAGIQQLILGLYLLFIVLLEAFYVLQYSLHGSSMAQGRYLFPALPALAILGAYGLLSCSRHQRDNALAMVSTASLATLSLYALLFVIVPAYPFAG